MAGAPARRIKRAVEQAVNALSEGRADDARRALQEARKASEETGIPLPQLPPDVGELWVTVFSDDRAVRRRKDVREMRMSDGARSAMLEAGELAADRLRDLMADDTIWEGPRRQPIEKLVPLLNLAMQRAYGATPVGAQKLKVDPGDVEDPQARDVGKMLGVMIRAAQSTPGMKDVTPKGEQDGE